MKNFFELSAYDQDVMFEDAVHNFMLRAKSEMSNGADSYAIFK